MTDYLVPMAAEMPPIVVDTSRHPPPSPKGLQGRGRGRRSGAPGAVLNAVNDAPAPFNARVTTQPITPEVVLRALGKL